MRMTAIFKDELFLKHDPGFYHFESPERLSAIYEQLDRKEIKNQFIYPSFSPASHEQLALNHTSAHIARVASTAGKNYSSLDPDTQTSPQSYDAACLAVGAVIKAADMLAAGEVDNCMALVRPPGHHAEADRAMGFCLFNNIAVGARYALDRLNMKRIFIVDWDLHHGNGTQKVFYDSDRVFYFSTHQYPYYPGSGALTEVGVGKGEGFTINVPLTGGQDDRAYGRIFRELLAPVARQYRPDILMVSAGFDIYQGDPLGTMAVTAQGFAYMTRILVGLAEELCGGRLLIVLEGGYNISGQRDCVMAVLGELAGIENCAEERFHAISAETVLRLEQQNIEMPVIEQVRNIAKKYWRL